MCDSYTVGNLDHPIIKNVVSPVLVHLLQLFFKVLRNIILICLGNLKIFSRLFIIFDLFLASCKSVRCKF